MRRPTLRLVAPAGAAVASAALLLPVAATAATATFPDPVDTSGGVDVVSAKVSYEGRLRVALRHTGMPDDAAVVTTYWMDTRPRRSGPEYRIRVRANADGPVLEAVDGWAGDGTEVGCPRARARADVFSDDPIVVRIPGRCLGDPKRVRMAAKVRVVRADSPAVVDWVPARRAFTGWVRRH